MEENLKNKLLNKKENGWKNIDTRELFKEAYNLSASYIICLHNHPSNDTTPSNADITFTDNIIKTGLIHGIKVVDHIIVGENNYYSFYERKKTYIKEEIC